MEEGTQEKFNYWVIEREKIRLLKESGAPKPWSADPVFQTTYFCNVRREDDRVTRWIRENYFPNVNPKQDDSIPNMIMARMVNKPESLERMDWPWNEFHEDVWLRVMSQPGAWGSAYIVSTNGRTMPKHEYVAGLLEEAFERFSGYTWPTPPGWLAKAHAAIQGLQGMGSFMAAQVVADLKNTEGHPLQKAVDWHTFSAPGPGSLRGLAWYWGRSKVTPSQYQDCIWDAWQNTPPELRKMIVCLQNMQNCFCEFDKYMRVSTGTGRSKRRYDGV